MRRPIVFVFLAGLGAILAAMVVFSALHKRESEVQLALAHTVQIVVAAKDIPIGTKLEPDAVKLVRWARDGVPQGAFTDPQTVSGSFAKSEFVANEPVVAGKLFMGEKSSGVMPLMIPPGLRAMSVPVDEVSDIAGFVQPHTHVDILVAVAGSGPGEPSFSRMVLQNIEVLAVAQEIEHVKDEPEVVRVVTLLVTPTDAEKLSLASHEGTLRLAMRNYSDSKIVSTSGIAISELMHNGARPVPVMQQQPVPMVGAPRPAHLAPSGPAPVSIEIMRDGKSSEAISFINSARVRRMNPEDSADSQPPPSAEPPMPSPSENPAETPVSSSSPSSSAAMAGAGANPFDAARGGPNEARSSAKIAAPLRPGEPGYVAAPKVYEVR